MVCYHFWTIFCTIFASFLHYHLSMLMSLWTTVTLAPLFCFPLPGSPTELTGLRNGNWNHAIVTSRCSQKASGLGNLTAPDGDWFVWLLCTSFNAPSPQANVSQGHKIVMSCVFISYNYQNSCVTRLCFCVPCLVLHLCTKLSCMHYWVTVDEWIQFGLCW